MSSRLPAKRILVIRNDRLGDFMLAWPALRLLKTSLPDATIAVLVPEYTRPMAELCPWIDEIVIDRPEESAFALARRLRSNQFDSAIALFSNSRIAAALWLAGIGHRFAPATKLAQFCYNHRLLQRRSRSEKPEYHYNLEVAHWLLQLAGHDGSMELHRPYLEFSPAELNETKDKLIQQHPQLANHRWVMIHAGNSGSANNLLPKQYADLATHITEQLPDVALLFSAGPGELDNVEQIQQQVTSKVSNPCVIISGDGVPALAHTIATVDLFISSSTGPLHIAGALNVATAAFYPRHRSGSPLRWQTLNDESKRLVFTPVEGADPKQVSACDVQIAESEIVALLKSPEIAD